MGGIFSFWKDREDDFMELDETESAYGPGPVLIMYRIPTGIDDDEILDMIMDGAPMAHAKGISLRRIDTDDDEDDDNTDDQSLLDMTVEDAITRIISKKKDNDDKDDEEEKSEEMDSSSSSLSISSSSPSSPSSSCPVLYFSGIDNDEMMKTYRIMAREIYEETNGRCDPACAKAVPNAMTKPLRRVLEEISGDHMEATAALDRMGDNGDDSQVG